MSKLKPLTKLYPELKQEVETIEKRYNLPPLYAVGFRVNQLWVIRYRRARSVSEAVSGCDTFFEPLETRSGEIIRERVMDPNHPSAQATFWSPEDTGLEMTDLTFLGNAAALRESRDRWLGLSHWMLEVVRPQGFNYWEDLLRKTFDAHSWERADLVHFMASKDPEYRALGLELMAPAAPGRIR